MELPLDKDVIKVVQKEKAKKEQFTIGDDSRPEKKDRTEPHKETLRQREIRELKELLAKPKVKGRDRER